MKKPVAVFDIDGTIFRSSLLIELMDALIMDGIFPPHASKSYQRAYYKWLNRQDSYEKYLEGVVNAFQANLCGVRFTDFLKISRRVVAFHQHRVYRFTRDLITELKNKNYYLLAISGSPLPVVELFGQKLGFHKMYGRMYELDVHNRFTGNCLHEELIKDKAKILQRALVKENLTLKKSIGVGDTENDISFLKMTARPIAFNPNQALYKYARRAGWEIVVERKDVIYHLKS